MIPCHRILWHGMLLAVDINPKSLYNNQLLEQTYYWNMLGMLLTEA